MNYLYSHKDNVNLKYIVCPCQNTKMHLGMWSEMFQLGWVSISLVVA